MKKELITGSSDQVSAQAKKYLDNSGKLKKVTIFFDNYNFLLTEYELMSPWVHMVLEFENLELQVESANCGYVGGGPGASIHLLKILGISGEYIESLVSGNRALAFEISDGVLRHLNTYQLFYTDGFISCYKETELGNKIKCDKNVSVIFQEKLVRMYNPQRTNWRGLLNLLAYMDNIRMEYYIGDHSPLDNGLYIGGDFGDVLKQGSSQPDIAGAEHSNLYLHGDNFNISCLIDREYENQVIEAVYLALTGRKLFEKTAVSWKNLASKIIPRKKEEAYGLIPIDEMKRKGRR